MTSVLTENERESIKGGKTHQERYVSSSGSAELVVHNIFCLPHLFTSIDTYLEPLELSSTECIRSLLHPLPDSPSEAIFQRIWSAKEAVSKAEIR